MSDCNHEHTKCMKCFRDITGGDAQLTPVTSVEVAPALNRIKELESLLKEANKEIESLKLEKSGIQQRKGFTRGHYEIQRNQYT